MNIVNSVAVYATLCKEQNIPLRWACTHSCSSQQDTRLQRLAYLGRRDMFVWGTADVRLL